MKELLPCPFCGATAERLLKSLLNLPAVRCSNEKCDTWPLVVTGISQDEADERWNTRSYTAELAALREQAEQKDNYVKAMTIAAYDDWKIVNPNISFAEFMTFPKTSEYLTLWFEKLLDAYNGELAAELERSK